jgi:iron complex outermembrane receptor protein
MSGSCGQIALYTNRIVSIFARQNGESPSTHHNPPFDMNTITNRVLRMLLGTAALCLLTAGLGYAQSATLAGTVTDATDGQPLAGANVVLMDDAGTMVAGGATNLDGTYRITGIPAGTYEVAARFVGYGESNEEVTLAAGQTRTLDFALDAAGFDLNTVVVTASRQREKVLDAPASVSVLDAREVTQVVETSAVAALRNTTGVDISQTGVDRREVVLRGFNNAFGGSAFALVDYRQTAAPALAVNLWSIMPNTPIDVERVEVVRGPGSALYGAGVDAGVVHFITKDPFNHPGTTLAVTGGTRSIFGGQFRQAGVFGENFGYKFVGEYLQADEWEYDADDEGDRRILDNALSEYNYDYSKYKASVELHYRPTAQTTLVGALGTSGLTTPTLSGIGNLQADDYGYTYGQLRLLSGGFFAQAFLNYNDAGDSFVYGQDLDGDGISDPVVDKGSLFSAQAQYDFALMQDQLRVIAGLDFETINPDTEGTINGRNEDDDTISEYGAYVQTTSSLGEVLDVTLALRGDYNNIVEDIQLSPRVALVFKANNANTFRATFNRAFSSPGSNSNFLDIIARSPDAALPFAIRGRGPGAGGFTFARNAQFGALAGTDLVASSLIGCFPVPGPTCGAATPAGLDLGLVYGGVYAGLAALSPQQLQGILAQGGITVDAGTAGTLQALLAPSATQVQGFSAGSLALLNPSNGQFVPTDDAVDIAPLEQTTSTTFEVGYKGILGDRVLLAVDGYYVNQENFIGPLLMETPVVLAGDVAADLTAALTTAIQNNPQLAGALGQLNVPAAQAAALIVGVASSDLPSGPIAIVQPNENNPGMGMVPELMLAYRNFGSVSYFGVDFSTQVLFSDALTGFANFSLVSDDFFDNEELDEENVSLALALNAPTFKGKAGFDYQFSSGFNFNLSGRYHDGFPVRSGPYVGEVDSYFMLDVGAGYDFSDFITGTRLDLSVNNVLNNEVRQFVGAPAIGTTALLRLTVSSF